MDRIAGLIETRIPRGLRVDIQGIALNGDAVDIRPIGLDIARSEIRDDRVGVEIIVVLAHERIAREVSFEVLLIPDQIEIAVRALLTSVICPSARVIRLADIVKAVLYSLFIMIQPFSGDKGRAGCGDLGKVLPILGRADLCKEEMLRQLFDFGEHTDIVQHADS